MVARTIPRRARNLAEVSDADRAAAHDAYLHKVLRFNERIQDLVRDHERERAAIEARRLRSISHSQALEHEMLSAFGQVRSLLLRFCFRRARPAVDASRAG